MRQLKGYDPIIVSNEDVAADIEEVAEAGGAETLQAQVYTHGDNAIWSLSSPYWTWEYNLSTGAWHRRQSYQPGRQHTEEPVPWRARFAARFDHCWYAQDELDGGLIEISAAAMQEPEIVRPNPIPTPDVPTVTYRAPLIARCESGPAKEMPVNLRLPTIYLDFTVGHDVLGVPDPSVFLTWSHDGGATWANPLERRLGGKGEQRTLVKLTQHRPQLVAGHAPALGMQQPGPGGVPRRRRAARAAVAAASGRGGGGGPEPWLTRRRRRQSRRSAARRSSTRRAAPRPSSRSGSRKLMHWLGHLSETPKPQRR